jgi:Uma2 family endonuclease
MLYADFAEAVYRTRRVDTAAALANSTDVTRTALTYRDYEALPDDGRRYEIHDGELSVTPAPGSLHQIVSMNLIRALVAHVPAVAPGLLLHAPLDVILADTTIVQPDIVYLAPDRLDRVSRRGIEGAPTLAIEILSPSTRTIDRVTKPRLYARYELPCLWLIDPEARTIEAFVLQRDRYLLDITATGPEAVDPPPFTGLGLVTDALWP